MHSNLNTEIYRSSSICHKHNLPIMGGPIGGPIMGMPGIPGMGPGGPWGPPGPLGPPGGPSILGCLVGGGMAAPGAIYRNYM